MSLSLRSLAVVSLVSALALVALTPGCSRQGEGERCDDANGDTDCDDGLKCTASNNLADGQTDRCCDPDGTTFSDSRCQPRSGSAGSGGTGGTGGTTAEGGSSVGGAGEPAPGGSGGSGGVPSTPDDSAGAGGVPTSSAGMPGDMPVGGNPSGGAPAGGQGGAD